MVFYIYGGIGVLSNRDEVATVPMEVNLVGRC